MSFRWFFLFLGCVCLGLRAWARADPPAAAATTNTNSVKPPALIVSPPANPPATNTPAKPPPKAIVPPAIVPAKISPVTNPPSAQTSATLSPVGSPPAATPVVAVAASAAAERAAYDAAIREFDAGLFDRASRAFAEFATAFPVSTLKPDVEVRGAFASAASETNAVPLISRLTAFAQEHPGSALAVNALLRASRTLLNRGQAAAALKLLDPTAKPLALAVATAERKLELLAAFQVRAEAALQVGQPTVAIASLQQAEAWVAAAPPEAGYDRLRLLLRAHLAAGAPAAAVIAGEKLKALVEAHSLTNQRPETISLLAGAMIKAGDLTGAATLFTNNLTGSTPIPLLREATMQVADHDRRAGRLVPARARLESFINTQPTDPQLDQFRWALGQVLFAQYQAVRSTGTNDPAFLVLAETHLAAALTNKTTPLRGDIQLLRGWCLWEGIGGTNQLSAAAAAFADAAASLPRTPAQAVARLKLADVHFRQGQPAAALTNYLAVAEGYAGVGDVDAQYGTLAWQQAMASAIASTNFAAAQRAMDQLIVRDPRGDATAEGLLQLSAEYAKQGNPARGRGLLEQFVSRFPDSPVRAELELSIADSLRREERWPAALGAYDRWLAINPAQTNRPRAEFGRALVLLGSGGTTNAVEQFTHLANRYPSNSLAPLALIWLGDYYSEQEQFGQAEQAYTSVLTNSAWIGLPRQHEARLRAAQAAMKWKQFGRANERLHELLNDKGTPVDFLPEGYLTLGQSLLQSPPADTNAPLASINDALDAFKAVTTFTNSLLVPEAWLSMAECHRQLTASNPASFASARELYLRALDPKLPIEPSVRARAKIGLGRLALQQSASRPPAEAAALEDEARDHFLDVALGKITAITGPLEAGVLKDAGHEAGLLLEARGLLKQADALYERLGSELPGMRAYWDARRGRLKRN